MSAVDMFFQAPPVTRTLVAATFVTSVAFYTGLLSGGWLWFDHSAVFKFPPQLWRFATCFLVTGRQFDMVLDPFYMYQYGKKCELGSKFSRLGDFVTYIVFVCLTLLGVNYALFGGAGFLTYPLIIAFAYTACNTEAGTTRIFVVDIPTKAVPLALCFMRFVMNQSVMAGVLPATGILAAHLYEFLTRIYPAFGGGPNLIKTPAFVHRMFETNTRTATTRAYGEAYRPATATGYAGGGGVLPASWRSRGSGRVLGGE